MADYKRENVFASFDVLSKLQELYRTSREPVFGLSTSTTRMQAERVDRALVNYYELVDNTAVELGLSKPSKDDEGDVVHYGIDFSNGEILSLP